MVKLIHGDCLKEMDKLIEDGVQVDLTVTSPPYDKLRTYNDSLEWNEDIWKQIIKKLYTITINGGIVVWVVGDSTIKGSETGTSFKQALWAKDCGFNLHDTMIYLKENLPFPSSNRYFQAFEYMFVFSKGKPKTFNAIKDKLNKSYGRSKKGSTQRNKNGETTPFENQKGIIPKYSTRLNYWHLYNAKRGGVENQHPAVFPEQLANDHIISWSNEGDTVFDPMMGSGTTGKMAIKNNRNFIGIEKVEEYYQIAQKRISK